MGKELEGVEEGETAFAFVLEKNKKEKEKEENKRTYLLRHLSSAMKGSISKD